mmetsp:Transcript_25903/g.56266  ORF Transcript_25903/g.56266 Transcript_25903/m.56266 type:complete len:266 (-) Transcript_25903:47-844(-)
MVILDGSLPAQQPMKKSQEWSPINRMLASKQRGGKTPSKAHLLPQDPTNLPRPMPASTTPVPPTTATSCTQTVSWDVLVAEAMAPERARAEALQKRVAALENQAKQREREALENADAARSSEAALLATATARIEELEREAKASAASKAAAEEALEAEKKARAEDAAAAKTVLEAERAAWRDKQSRFEEDQSAASKLLRSEKSAASALAEEVDKLKASKSELEEALRAITAERDRLLERLEVEQAEIAARVAKLEERDAAAGRKSR